MSEEESFSEADRAAAFEFAREKIADAKPGLIGRIFQLDGKATQSSKTTLDLSAARNADKTRALSRLPSEISGLTGMQTLFLNNTQVSDLSPLQSLSGLLQLDLRSTQVSDLSPLQGLGALQWLYLDNTQVSDIGPLEGLRGLQRLTLNNTQVSDLSSLRALSALHLLHLRNMRISDLVPLRDLSSLQVLSLRDSDVEDLKPLSMLGNLRLLNLQGSRVADLLPLAGLSKLGDTRDLEPRLGLNSGLWFGDTPAADRDAAHQALTAIDEPEDRAKQVLQYLNGEHLEFGGPPEPYRPAITPFEFTSQDKAGIRFEIDGYLLRLDVYSESPATEAEKLLPELQDSIEDLIDTFETPNSVMARGILRRATRMQVILSSSVAAIAEEAVVLWQLSVALGSFMDEHALAVADRADPLDRLSASRMGALQRVIEASSVFVRLFPAAEALDDSRGGFLREKFGPDRVRAFIDQTTRAQVLDEQSALFIKGLAEIAARQGPQADKARSVTMTGIGTLIRIVTHYGKGAITGIALGVGASIGAEIDDEFQLGINAAQMLRDGEQEVRAILADLAPDVRNAVRGTIEEIFGSDVPLPPVKPPVQ